MTKSQAKACTPTESYPGGKSNPYVWQWICSLQPFHTDYDEPTAGHAGVFRNKIPCLRTQLFDDDPVVVEWLKRYVAHAGLSDCVRVEQCCGIEYVESLEGLTVLHPELRLVYLDPPYLLSTRKRLKVYRHEWTVDEHERLLKACLRCECSIMISCYDNELYRDLLTGWEFCERPNVITRGGSVRTEILCRNPVCQAAPSTMTMQYSALGGDFRERQRVSRLIKRWESDFEKRSPVEQRALLLALMSKCKEV